MTPRDRKRAEALAALFELRFGLSIEGWIESHPGGVTPTTLSEPAEEPPAPEQEHAA